ncbi:hypothetical protein ECZC06_53770 [Escherichia coli]|nr:hypothetical protein ECZC06_53770 [Escherichia coli]
MSEPLSGSGTAVALGGATVFGLFTGTDFGIVFGAFAGALFVATMPQALSVWRVVAHFLVSFIVGVLGARVLSAWIASKTGYDGTSADALCAVLVAVVSVKILSFIHQQDIASLVSGLFSRLRVEEAAMLSNLPGLLNVALCTVIVLTLFFYRRRDSRHKPLMSWLAWLLMLLYAFAPLSYLCGRPLAANWLAVGLNLLFCVLVIRARGNVSKVFVLRRR